MNQGGTEHPEGQTSAAASSAALNNDRSTLPLSLPARRSRGGRLRPLQGVIGLVAIVVMAILISPYTAGGQNQFLGGDNPANILRQVSEIGIMALGMTFVVLTGGIDLSVGSILAVAGSIAAVMLTQTMIGSSFAIHIATAIAVTLLASALIGLLNGVVISAMGIQPFIMTLAAMLGLRGLARTITNNQTVDFSFAHGSDAGAVFCDVIGHKAMVIGCFVALAIVLAVLLRRTVFGRYTRAIGDNEKAALYAGLPVVSVKIWVYLMSGLFSGLAGILHAAQAHQGNPNDGVGYELDAIAAVVIGGTSLSGGKGSIIGTIVGTLIMGVLTNILGLKDVAANQQLMIKAVIIVLAVWIQTPKRKL